MLDSSLGATAFTSGGNKASLSRVPEETTCEVGICPLNRNDSK